MQRTSSRISLGDTGRAMPNESTTPDLVEQMGAMTMIWADRLVEEVTAYTDIHEARAAAERLARERG
jgi:hypothetical protein